MEKPQGATVASLAGKWAPLIVAIGGGIGATTTAISQRDTDLLSLRKDQEGLLRRLEHVIADDSARNAFGPGGFSNDAFRAGIEASIRTYLESRGVHGREYWEHFYQLNPSLVRPASR